MTGGVLLPPIYIFVAVRRPCFNTSLLKLAVTVGGGTYDQHTYHRPFKHKLNKCLK